MSGRNDSAAFPRPFLCYVTDRHALKLIAASTAESALLKKISAFAAAGIAIQIREKDLSGRALAALTRKAVHHVRELPAPASDTAGIIVNERMDVAVAEKAAGVHLGEKSLPIEDAKRLLEVAASLRTGFENFLVGASCHSAEAARHAEQAGAHYIFFGPVFATPSKAPYGEPQGLARLADVCRSARIPVIAIGGITLDNARSCVDAGAGGVAAIRLFQDARDARAIAVGLRERLT